MRLGRAPIALAVWLAACGGRDEPPAAPQPPPGPVGPPAPPGPAPLPPAEALEVTLARYNLERLNALRAAHGRAPLVADPGLAAFALAASQRLARDHAPHAHFVAAAARDPAFGRVSAENQGDPRGVPAMDADPVASGKKQIDAILGMMMAEGRGGGHYENVLGPAHRRVGVGLVLVGGALFLTNDFSD